MNIKNGNIDEIMNFIESSHLDADFIINNFDWTLLHVASYYGNANLVNYLIEKGANIDAVNKSGYTPIELANYQGFKEIYENVNKANHCYENLA